MVATAKSAWPQARGRLRSAGIAFALLALQALAAAGNSAAADLRVLCPSALRGPALEIARSYARQTGHRVEFLFASAGAIHKRAAMNERADVVIGGDDAVVALAKLGVADAATVARVARTALALAGRPGAVLPAPDLDGAVAAALRAGASVGVPDPQRGMAGSAQVAELIDALGLQGDLQSRLRPVGSIAEAARLLESGDIDLALLPMSELGASGLRVSGPIASPPTRGLVYAAAVLRAASVPDAARGFVAHLRSAAAVGAWQQAGYLAVD